MIYTPIPSLIQDFSFQKINYMLNHSLANLTTFKLGGNAEVLLMPKTHEELLYIILQLNKYNLSFYLLGGGSNVLVSDLGLEGVTISLNYLNRIERDNNTLLIDAGTTVKESSEYALQQGLGGLDFIYGMPGSLGGAIWMNARCYGGEISHIFKWADTYDSQGHYHRIKFNPSDWQYKKSPFQNTDLVITRVGLELYPEETAKIHKTMQENFKDRKNKGHFIFPSAGSFFKNNYNFGAPSGKLIDEQGWRGISFLGAAVSPHHANFLVNKQNATAQAIHILATSIEKDILQSNNITLEREVQLMGFFPEVTEYVPIQKY